MPQNNTNESTILVGCFMWSAALLDAMIVYGVLCLCGISDPLHYNPRDDGLTYGSFGLLLCASYMLFLFALFWLIYYLTKANK